MKLKITYQPEEQEEAAGVLAALLRLLPGAKVRRDKSGEPKQMTVYVTIKWPKTLDLTHKQRYNRIKE